MTDEQKCICDLFALLDDVAEKIKKNDFSLVRKGSGIGGGIYLGMPPICRFIDELLEKHGDVIYSALREKESEE